MTETPSKRVLVVDDSHDIQELLRVLLEAEGYTIECTSNGEDALNYLSLSTDLPDVILLDMRMPVMDGFTFLKLQQGMDKLRGIPTVVMTGIDEIEMTRLKTESAAILLKPLTISSLLAALKQTAYLN
jgi:CheY-like chemotaxis protein